VGAIARFLITFLAARGVTLSEDMATQLVLGAVSLGALLWSLRQKKQTIEDAQ
jgi:hypothetical protein